MPTFHGDKLALGRSPCPTLDTVSLLTTGSELLGAFCPPRAEDPLGPHSQPLPQDPLSSLERQLALQLQIAEAARRLCAEENLSRQARRQRKHAALQEEKKLRDLQRCLSDRRRNSEPPPTTVPSLGRGEPPVLSHASFTQLSCDGQRSQRSQHSPASCFWLVLTLMFHVSAIRLLLSGSTQVLSYLCTP